MPRDAFSHVETWVFDLDNTLYPPTIQLFDQIEARMNAYVMQILGLDPVAASALRRHYWQTYGTTLAGLMHEHALDPDPYLHHVHDIDLTSVPEAPALRAVIDRLQGRKIVFTNGSRRHAERVTAAIGLAGAFDALYGFEDAGYVAKPRPEAFAAVFGRDGFATGKAAMFEDDPRNLAVPHGLGMRTVLVGPPGPREAAPPHVHHETADLTDFLERIV